MNGQISITGLRRKMECQVYHKLVISVEFHTVTSKSILTEKTI